MKELIPSGEMINRYAQSHIVRIKCPHNGTCRRHDPVGMNVPDSNGFKITPFEGVTVRYRNPSTCDNGKAAIESTGPLIQLSYILKGKMHCMVRCGMDSVSVLPGKQSYDFIFLPANGQLFLEWDPKRETAMLELAIHPDTMRRLLPANHPFFALIEDTIKKRKPLILNGFRREIHYKAGNILNEMISCPCKGKYRHLFFAGKIAELLLLEFERSEPVNGHARSNTSLRQTDIDRMHEAKDIITKNLQQPYSLMNLARKVGTNEAYLKRHFKEVFGTTVFGFLQELRMNKAMEMLSAGSTVSETAAQVGYCHASHFTRAFKRYFGINPSGVGN